MWAALLMAIVLQGGQVQVGVQVAPEAYKTEAECKTANEAVEPQVKESKEVKGYVLKCVKVETSEFKHNGKDV